MLSLPSGNCRTMFCPLRADVAQLVEQRFRKPQVTGSNPVVGCHLFRISDGGLLGRSSEKPAGLFNGRLGTAQLAIMVESFMPCGWLRRSVAALCASRCSFRKHARFAKCAFRPALCLIIGAR